MGVDKSKIGLTFAHPRVSREHQEAELRNAGAQWIVHVGDHIKTWEPAVLQLRPGDVMFIYAAPMVPAPAKKFGAPLQTQWTAFNVGVRERGAHYVEVLTGRRSNVRKEFDAINRETHRLLRAGGKRLPSTGQGPGRKAAKADEAIKAIWTSRDYQTNAAACRHMPPWSSPRGPQPWTPRMCRMRWGPSGRPWKSKKARRSTTSTSRAKSTSGQEIAKELSPAMREVIGLKLNN